MKPPDQSRAARVVIAGIAALVVLFVVGLAWPHAAPAPRVDANGTSAPTAPVPPSAAPHPGSSADDAATARREPVAVEDVAAAESGDDPVAPWRVVARVLDDADEPVAGATVTVFAARSAVRSERDERGSRLVWLGADRTAPVQTGITGTDGNCTLTFDRTRVHVAAWHPESGRSIAHAVDCRRPPPDGIVRLWLARPVAIQGTVLGADATPVPFAAVDATLGAIAVPGAQARARYLAAGPTVADANGRFRVETVAGATVVLRAQSDGVQSLPVTVAAADDVELALLLPGAAAITGRVVDAAGAPVRGQGIAVRRADVQQRLLGIDAALASRDRAKLSALRELGVPVGVGADERGAATDEDGRFRVEVNAFAEYVVEVVEPGVVFASSRIAVTPQQPLPHVVLRLQPPATLGGRVRFVPPSQDAPSNVAKVAAVERVGPAAADPAMVAQAQVAADGTFTLRVPPGHRWDVLARSGELETRIDDVGSPASGIDLVLAAPPPRIVRGELWQPEGAPPGRAPVLRWVRRQVASHGEVWDQREAEAQWEGTRFTVQLPPSGAWYLVASPFGVEAIAGPLDGVNDAQPVVLRPPVAATLPVRVVTAAGLPVRHLAVDASVARPWQPSSTLRTDGDGRCTLPLPEGRATVTVRRSCEVLARRELDVAAGTNPELVLVVRP